jgi:hypothetical protein
MSSKESNSLQNFNIEVFSPECSFNTDFWGKLKVKLLIPIAMTILSGVFQIVMNLIERSRSSVYGHRLTIRSALLKFVHIFDKLTMLLFTLIISSIFSVFDCVLISNNTYVIRSNPSSRCFDKEWIQYVAEISFFAVLYLIIFPIRITFVFLRMRNNPQQRLNPVFLHLTRGFKPEFFWWDMVLLIKRLIFVMSSQFFFSSFDASFRLLGSAIVFMVFTALDLLAQPYQTNPVAKNNLSLMLILILLCQGMIFEREEGSVVFIAFVIILVIIGSAHSLYVFGKSLMKKVKKSTVQIDTMGISLLTEETRSALLCMHSEFKTKDHGEIEFDLSELRERELLLSIRELLSARRTCDILYGYHASEGKNTN